MIKTLIYPQPNNIQIILRRLYFEYTFHPKLIVHRVYFFFTLFNFELIVCNNNIYHLNHSDLFSTNFWVQKNEINPH